MKAFWRRTTPTPRSTNYVSEFRGGQHGLEFLEHLDGVSWFDAPRPPKKHECWAQTRGFMSMGHVERCACGAISGGDGYWMERNSAGPGRGPVLLIGEPS